jgi:cell division protein FtsB
MFDFQEKRRYRRLLYSKMTVALLFLLFFFVARGTWSMLSQERESRRNLDGLRPEMEKLELREAELASEIESLRTERGAEEELRSNFPIAMEGEGVIYIIDEVSLANDEEIRDDVSLMRSIFNWLSKKMFGQT